MIKYKLHATIGLPDYSNLQPEIELEGENLDELHATAMGHIGGLWEKYAKTPLPGATGQIEANKSTLKKLLTFTGEEILYDDAAHAYFSLEGKKLMSGSEYANKNSPKFDQAMILPKTAKAWEVSEDTLKELWKVAGDIANSYGSSVHSALELYHKYRDIGSRVQEKKGLEFNYILPKNPHVRQTVLDFVEKFGAEALAEVVVSDSANGRAGTIDRLQITGERSCRIGDYKTNADLDDKKKLKYQKQLSFYAHILIGKGWGVDGLDLYYLDPEKGWLKEEMEILPIEK